MSSLYDDIQSICNVPTRKFREDKLEDLVKLAITLIENHAFEIDGVKMYSKRAEQWLDAAREVLE